MALCCTDTIWSVQQQCNVPIGRCVAANYSQNGHAGMPGVLHQRCTYKNCVSATPSRNADDLPLCFTDRCTYMLHCFVAPVFPIQNVYDVLGQQNFAWLYCLHINKSACKRLTLFLTEFTKFWENQFARTRFWPSQAWEHSCKLSLDHVQLLS